MDDVFLGARVQAERSVSRRAMLFGRLRPADPPGLQIADHCLSLTGVACRACEDVCAVRAIRFRPNLGGVDRPSIDAEACTGCGDCLSLCPVKALSLEVGKRLD